MIHDSRRAPRRHVTEVVPVIDTMTDEVVGQLGNLSESGMLLIASAVAPSSGRLAAMIPPNGETVSQANAAS